MSVISKLKDQQNKDFDRKEANAEEITEGIIVFFGRKSRKMV